MINTGMFGLLTTALIYQFNDYYHTINEALTSNYPLYQKALGIVTPMILYALTPIMTAATIDGVVDMFKGTHHYFGCRVWQKLTRNPKTKQKIESDLEEMLKNINKSVQTKNF